MEILDIGGLDGPAFASAHELQALADQRLDPDLPTTTIDEFRLYAIDDRTEFARHDRVAAFDGDIAVALGHLELGRDSANPGFCSAEIEIRDDRIDAGRAALAELLDRAEADGRTSMLGWGHHAHHGAFWTDVGASERYTERTSALDLTAVDADLMRQWIDAHDERAADIRLVRWNHTCPDEHLDAFVDARNAMNDAPLEAIDVADTINTAESTRLEEQAFADVGWEIQTIIALDPDGGAAAMTAVLINNHRPRTSWQGDTVVLEHQRRRGIGRWIKAEMWQWLRAERPELTRLQTGNAESNDAMLAINVAMGYEPVHVMAGWQADLSTLREGLSIAERTT